MRRHLSRHAVIAVLLLLPACSAVDEPTAPSASALRTEEAVVGAIEILPSDLHLELGEAQQLRARVLDQNGRPMSVPVTWSSSDPRVALVGTTGLATALSLGVARINVAAQGVVAVGWITTYPVSRIAWQRESDIYVMNGFGNDQTALATGDAADPAWSPDGARIAFVRYGGSEGHIWVMNPDGSGQTQITSGPDRDEFPRWSPAGSAIGFERRLYTGGTDIWTVTPNGGALTRVTFDGAGKGSLSWSPAGDRLAFLGSVSGSGTKIFVANADGTGLANLSGGGVTSDDSPDWSPGGSKIAFGRAPSPVPGDIYLMNADGTGKTNLTGALAVYAREPVWSPDGTRILFQGGNDLYVMNADGSGLTQLTNSPTTQEDKISWSADGGRIAFRQWALDVPIGTGNGDICVITVNGSKVWNLTSSPSVHDDDPVWRP